MIIVAHRLIITPTIDAIAQPEFQYNTATHNVADATHITAPDPNTQPEFHVTASDLSTQSMSQIASSFKTGVATLAAFLRLAAPIVCDSSAPSSALERILMSSDASEGGASCCCNL